MDSRDSPFEGGSDGLEREDAVSFQSADAVASRIGAKLGQISHTQSLIP